MKNSELLSQSYPINFYDREQIRDLIHHRLLSFADVTTDATGIPLTEIIDEQREVMEDWDFVLTIEERNKIWGYAGFLIHDVPKVGDVLHGGGKMIRKSLQGRSIGTQLTAEAVRQFPSINYFSVISQNPASISSFMKALPPSIFAPIHVDYTNDENLSRILEQSVIEGELQDVDMSTGLLKRTYTQGKLGDYTINQANLQILDIEKRLQAIGLERDKGDAVLVAGRKLFT